ncbi:unnamed protein product [Linum trigynum]|uniref:Uncharacterized protein n=1 Tax=Linum trigynum TaxID=586398 RepID=A0AAV2GP27_9ROSI
MARTYIRGREEERQVASKKFEAAPLLATGRSSVASNPSQAQGLRISPSKKTSPRGFSLNKPPQIQLGGGKLKRQGKRGTEDERNNRNMHGDDQSEDCGSVGDPIAVPPELDDHPSGVLAQTRRRLLILETDSDDDALAVDQVPKPTDTGPAKKNPLQKEKKRAGSTRRPSGDVAAGRADRPYAGSESINGSASSPQVDNPVHPNFSLAQPEIREKLRKAQGKARGGQIGYWSEERGW